MPFESSTDSEDEQADTKAEKRDTVNQMSREMSKGRNSSDDSEERDNFDGGSGIYDGN